MAITAMAVLARLILGFMLGLASPAVAAGPSGGQLIVTPNTLNFRLGTPPAVAVAEVTVQVMVRATSPGG